MLKDGSGGGWGEGGTRGAAEAGGPDRLLAEGAGPVFLLLSMRLLVLVPEDGPQKSPMELGGGRGEGSSSQAFCFGATRVSGSCMWWETRARGGRSGPRAEPGAPGAVLPAAPDDGDAEACFTGLSQTRLAVSGPGEAGRRSAFGVWLATPTGCGPAAVLDVPVAVFSKIH